MMRIDKELFDKLSKSNQEEYKSKRKEIDEINCLNLWVTALNYIIYTILLMLIILPLWKLAFGIEITLSLFQIGLLAVRIFIWFAVIGFIIDYTILLGKIFRKEKIKKEYFKIEVRDEKRKR